MPDFPIVDSHVHLYDPGVIRYSWIKGKPPLDQAWLLPEFDRERGPVEVERIVFVEVWADPGQHLQEASFIDGLAAKDRRIQGMVAAAPLEHGAAITSDLEKLAAHGITRGVRRLIEIESEPGFCLQPRFVEAVKLLPRFDLSFDICIKHWQLEDAIALVRQCPEVRFVLDHIGKAGDQGWPDGAVAGQPRGVEPAAQRLVQAFGRRDRGRPRRAGRARSSAPTSSTRSSASASIGSCTAPTGRSRS